MWVKVDECYTTVWCMTQSKVKGMEVSRHIFETS